jgi:AcrR family transcriptional regulator
MTGRRPRNIAATRTAILESGRRMFTQHGYGGVGVREIADGAQADKALITRYFGSKAGLFAEAVPATFDPSALLEGDRSDFGRRAATHIVEHNAGKDLDPMIATIRSLSDPEACELLRQGLEERFITVVAQWLGTEDAARRAAILTAQLMGLSIAVNVLALQPLTEISQDDLVDLIAPLLQSLVDQPLTPQPPARRSDPA